MIEVLDYTKKPLTMLGLVAKECYNSNPKSLSDLGKDCIESGHDRLSEFADVTIVISEYSARFMRELYTHIVGVSRVQASTRYINYKDMNYYIPDSIKNNQAALNMYEYTMEQIKNAYELLNNLEIPKEDIANILPLGMHSKMVLKINSRALFHMAEIRTCKRAYHEFRKFMKELIAVLKTLDDEWNEMTKYMKTKCDKSGKCNEKKPCEKGKLLQNKNINFNL